MVIGREQIEFIGAIVGRCVFMGFTTGEITVEQAFQQLIETNIDEAIPADTVGYTKLTDKLIFAAASIREQLKPMEFPEGGLASAT